MKYRISFLLLVFFILISSNMLLANNKNCAIPLNSSQNPWRSIGILENNNKKCVAIVVGDNIILTSAYCLFDENGTKINPNQQLIFKSGYNNGFYLTKSTIISFLAPNIIFPPKDITDTKNSWAFLFTNQNIAKITGCIKIYRDPITSEYLKNHKILTVGYSDKNANILLASIKCKFNNSGIEFNNNCFIDTDSAPILLQNCSDNFHPLIGSPVISIDKNNNVGIIGIVSAKLTKNNKATNTNEFINVIVPMTSLHNNYSNKEEDNVFNNQELQDSLQN